MRTIFSPVGVLRTVFACCAVGAVAFLVPSLSDMDGVRAQRATAPAAATRVAVADYERAEGLQDKFDGQVIGAPDDPVWLPSGRFWYRRSVQGGSEFVLVDPASPAKRPAFDHARLAAAIGTAAKRSYTAATLPFSTFTFSNDERGLSFTDDDNFAWTCTLADYGCTRGAAVAVGEPGAAGRGRAGGGGRGAAGAGRGGGRGGRGLAAGGGVTSPDGRHVAFIRDHNISVRAADASADTGVALSTTGTAALPFTIGAVTWSPDSARIAAWRVAVPGDRRMVRYVESSPADQVQPKTFERQYAKPGDALDRQERVLLDVAGRRQITIDSAAFPNPYSLSPMEWRKDSRAVTFEYNERGHQLYRLIEVNATTGSVRTVIEERPKTFIDYRSRISRHDVADGAEIVWMSERDGWSHLYLYDGATGRVKNQITKGPWIVRSVVRVDEAARQVWFTTGGINPKQDPYFVQYYRINFDGTGLTPMTNADGNHVASFSPDNRFYVDTWSRVDLAPVSQLRRSSDGQVVLELERADLAPLVRAGWRAPEAFTAKGRDGTTDIFGVIIRPTQFDPARKYPVVESIYAGPHGSFVPKSFSSFYPMQALAELGFIVVQIDGMGTSNRSKAFHDVAWKNIGDAGFPDRILWHQAVAKKYPWYDITRVGIYGGSAGGQNALGGLLFHPEFYDAAVSFAGCHDNRMDKIWWNEQWMGYPIGPEYEASSNVVHAKNLKGRLLLVVGELDTNVDPSSTMQVVNALIKANKQFDLLVMPGEEHSAGRRGPSAPYGNRKLWDFFVQHLQDTAPPHWNAVTPAARQGRVRADALDMFGPSWSDVHASWDAASR